MLVALVAYADEMVCFSPCLFVFFVCFFCYALFCYVFLYSNTVIFFLQDLKDDISKAEMCAARTLLEKSTMMLLTTSKVNLFPLP